ncbi:hypothetical protein C5C18_09915 [Rathayibacter tritici]|uniref:AraC family transcriptional regulator n=1 Tax=Rathayibacter tritici TaxID=33888 RepID=UPI000CE73168|nr:AraC family transcriptional regulator [Rathayibacter tritici]PPF61517.1 hypothetical protein C5C21_15000 [Rathayibacter tritici]PPG06687.1 hypothetical protein C5C18_09915 [Rathayibacter tritici]
MAEGIAARDWLLGHGVTVTSGGGYLRLAADALCAEEMTMRRMWHTAREFERRGWAGGAVIGLLVEGSLTLSGGAEGMRHEVEEGGGFVLWSAASLSAISGGRCGTVEVSVGRDTLERFFSWSSVGASVIPAGLATSRILVAAASAVLSGSLQTRDPAWSSVCGMIGSGVSALLAELGPPLLPSAPVSAARLVRRAHTVIERGCTDAAFDVRTLATDLAISVTRLYAAFEYSPRTPAQEIRSARVRLARRMLDHRPAPTAADQEAVAELSGFASAEAMTRALRAERSHGR